MAAAWLKRRPSADRRVMAYLEGHAVIDQANRIFGYGRWGSEAIGPLSYREFKTQSCGTEQVATVGLYWARVRVRVHGCESRSDVGCGVVAEQTADAHETAIKTAVTDGTKRALRGLPITWNGTQVARPGACPRVAKGSLR
ncbi:MAG: hypothetical protein GEU73_03515 [Chloroflexi bacterium]|nr:hypothetical protein [Chloroflexota bacterium]